MQHTVLPKPASPEAPGSGWEQTINEAFFAAEAAEMGLAITEDPGNIDERLSTGSFYTPADVVDHFWREYFDFHDLADLDALRRHLANVTFVEPSAGAGIFLFGLMRAALSAGCSGEDIQSLRIVAVDVNSAALKFIDERLRDIEARSHLSFSHIQLQNLDFLDFTLPAETQASFVGNPPYVRNKPGSRWKNLYADFLQRMLDLPLRQRSISMIVPLSVAFSRDYVNLRRALAPMPGLRLESFDNIPDCLFKAGKPGNQNTNKANSQRCSILSVRDAGPIRREATALQRWFRGDRSDLLARSPAYFDVSSYQFDQQIPRPSVDWIMPYLEHPADILLGDLLHDGEFGFAVAGVGRNYIGLRDPVSEEASSVLLKFASQRHMLWALQVLGSPLFYEFWRTVGDGFHITRSDIARFPMTSSVISACMQGESRAKAIWASRAAFERTKLNSGKEICSFDFRGQFDDMLSAVKGGSGSSSAGHTDLDIVLRYPLLNFGNGRVEERASPFIPAE